MKKHIITLSSLLFVMVMFSGCSSGKQAKVLKLAHGLDPTHPVSQAMEFMADRCKEI